MSEALEMAKWLEVAGNVMEKDIASELRRLSDIENEHRALLVNEQNLQQELAALKASLSTPVAWIYTSELAPASQKFITRYASDLTTYKANSVTKLYAIKEPT